MQDNTSVADEETNVEEVLEDASGRRAFLGKAALAGLGLAALKMMPAAEAAKMPKQPEADTGHDYPMARPSAKNEKQFRLAFIGPATLSLLTSQIAVDKASNAAVREFANFELREQMGATMVLKDLGTPTPPLNAMQRSILKQMRDLPRGAAFDKAYIKAQLSTHEYLRDLTNSFLANSKNHKSMLEKHGRHLATLALGTLKEHVVHCKNITRSL